MSSFATQCFTALSQEYPELARTLARLWTELQHNSKHSAELQHFQRALQQLKSELRDYISDADFFGSSEKFLQAVRPIFQFLYHEYFRVSVKGAQHIPQRGKALMIANHSGVIPFDASMLALAIFNQTANARMPRFLVDDFVFQHEKLAKFIQLLGGVRASHQSAEQLLQRGHMVINFPEGTKGVGKLYSEKYQLERFGRGGFIKLAIRSKTPIIPVAIIGAEEIYPLLHKSTLFSEKLELPYLPATPSFPVLGPIGFIPLPTKWTIVFGKPILFPKAKLSDIENENFVLEQSEKIRTQIQSMLKKELKLRKNIWGEL